MIITTDLGRRVFSNDWVNFQKDRILCALYNVGQANAGIERSDLASLTGLKPDELQRLLDKLLGTDLIYLERSVYRLTLKGLALVCSVYTS